MTIVGTTSYKARNGRTYERIIVQCDMCFVNTNRVPASVKRSDNHYCSRKCSDLSKSEGPSRQKLESTCVERYGKKNPQQIKEFKEKTKVTLLKRYGVDNPMHISNVKEKIRHTTLKRYGVDNVAKSDVIKEKIKLTNIARHGVPWIVLLPEVQALSHALDAYIKGYETRKEKGFLKSSNVENRVYKICEAHFNRAERWVIVNGWSIDLKIEHDSKVFYVQIDGVYWHGLDRSLCEIQTSGSKIDKQIIKTFHRDVTQNEWFVNNSMNLHRLTDVFIKSSSDDQILENIRNVFEKT